MKGIVNHNPKYVLSIATLEVMAMKLVKWALESEEWKAAICDEYNAMICNDTWEIVDRTPVNNIINNIYLFKFKEKFDGSV